MLNIRAKSFDQLKAEKSLFVGSGNLVPSWWSFCKGTAHVFSEEARHVVPLQGRKHGGLGLGGVDEGPGDCVSQSSPFRARQQHVGRSSIFPPASRLWHTL